MTVSHSDDEWCQIKETLTMLYLSAAQIESSMQDGSHSIHQLADSLGAISNSANLIREALNGAADTEQLETVRASSEQISSHVGETITVCQFHDRVTQRLDHVTQALSGLCDLISDPGRYHDPGAWKHLQEEIRNNYTMDAERLMFERIMMGATVEEALEIYDHQFNASAADDTSDEIELF